MLSHHAILNTMLQRCGCLCALVQAHIPDATPVVWAAKLSHAAL